MIGLKCLSFTEANPLQKNNDSHLPVSFTTSIPRVYVCISTKHSFFYLHQLERNLRYGSSRTPSHIIDPPESDQVCSPIQHKSCLPYAASKSVRTRAYNIDNTRFGCGNPRLLGSSVHRPLHASRNRTLALCTRGRPKTPIDINPRILPTMQTRSTLPPGLHVSPPAPPTTSR